MPAEEPEPRPSYWERLSEQDKQTYMILRSTFSSANCKNRRNKSTETFKEIIDSLKAFVMRGDSDDRNRALVCGIYWLRDSIAINTRQLIKILSKCKSSINGSFQQLGYGTIPAGTDSCGELIKVFPELNNNFSELRQWSVRQPMSSALKPSSLAELLQRTLQNQNQNQQFFTPPPNQLEVMNLPSVSIGVNNQFTSAPPAPIVDEPIKDFNNIQDQPLSPQPDIDSYAFENDDISNFMWTAF